MLPSHAHLLAFYRSYLRLVHKLPHHYLRTFYTIKARDDFRALLDSKPQPFRSKYNRLKRELKHLETALHGDHKHFGYILDVAYGRKGKLRWEILQPLLNDLATFSRDPIIASEPKSRLPRYSPELTALLTNSISRITGKALDRKQLLWPPTLPERANPKSDDARLLGPFSKRREVNIRWRYFTEEWKKVRPPLELNVEKESDPSFGGVTPVMNVRDIGLQGAHVQAELAALVGSPQPRPQLTRRQRIALGVDRGHEDSESPSRIPSRWLRRRYQELLGRTPILSVVGDKELGLKYTVSLPENAISSAHRFGSNRLVEADQMDMAWQNLIPVQPRGSRKIKG